MNQPSSTRRPGRRRLILSIVALVVFAVLIAVLAFRERIRTAPIPTGTPPGDITFISNRFGSWDVLMLSADGEITNLTAEGDGPTAHDYFGSWGLDSERLNVLSNRSGEMGPTQIESDGGNPRSLDIVSAVVVLFGEGRLDWDAAWSPGGAMMAWSSLRDFNLEIYTIDTNADFLPDNATRVTQDGGRDWFPAWSPDGETLAFASDRSGTEDIYLADTANGEITQLTSEPWDELHPVWSMDGEQILYIYDENDGLLDGVLQFRVMDSDGGNQRTFDETTLFEGDPTWSVDGDQVLFMSNQEGDWNIYIMDADGENVRRLTDDPGDDLFPVWRP